MSVSELEATTAKGAERVYLLMGDAVPLVERARASIEAAVKSRLGPAAFNHGRYRASEPGAVQAFTTARTLPMMADLRLVELRDLQEASAEVFEAFVEYLKDPSPSTVFVAVGTTFPKVEKGGSNWGARVKAAIKGKGTVVTLTSEAASPARFAIEVATGVGKILSPENADRLVAVVGGDLGRIQQEVAKLAVFVGDAPTIDEAAISAAGSMVAEAVVWDLTAGLAARDVGLALDSLHRLQEQGDDPRKLLGMIVWQFREILRVAELAGNGASDREITSQVRIRWDLLKKIRPMLDKGFPDAPDLLRRLATANRQMNSHRAGAERILEGLVLEMLDGRLRRPPPVPRAR